MSHTPITISKLLIVDDDDLYRENLVRAFNRRGIETASTGDGTAAIDLLKERSPDGAVVDLRLEQESGLAVMKQLLAAQPSLKVVVLTAYGTIATALEAIKGGAVNYLTKPVDVDVILAALHGTAAPQRPLSELPSPEQVEWDYINRAVYDHDGNVTRAAQALGLHRRSLQRKLKNPPPLK